MRGRYAAGAVNGEAVKGFRGGRFGNADATETFVAIRPPSTTGAGPACRSTCAPASASVAAIRKS